MTKFKNIGILAHVDAGKTTITEHFLHLCGATRYLGNVDKGTTITDSLDVERDRGISVQSAVVSFQWQNTTINLIDTPGHADFASEVERSLRVLDAAVLVISSVEGVQNYTYTLWQALKTLNIPTIIFINKVDRAGADTKRVIFEIQQELGATPFPLYAPVNEGNNNAGIINLWQEETLSDDLESFKALFYESLIEQDEHLLEKYLEGNPISIAEIERTIRELSVQKVITPVLVGVAKNGIGVAELLNSINDLIPLKEHLPEEKLSATVFKIEHDQTIGRLAHIRVFKGTLKNRENIFNQTLDIEEKVTRIQKVYTKKPENIKEIIAGDIGLVAGLNSTRTGDILGTGAGIPQSSELGKPLLTSQVKPIVDKDYVELAGALTKLASEDPVLDFQWLKDEKEFHIKIMGTIQIEILESILLQRFNIKAKFLSPTIIYNETPTGIAEGYVKYWWPKPSWAIMKFRIEPGPRGSGIIYESKVSFDDIRKKYQNEVAQTIPNALRQGIKGWEVTDIKITLIEGEDHEEHSNPGDFILATPMGLMRALKNSGTSLLEPVSKYKIMAQEAYIGKITSDLTNMRATPDDPVFENGNFTLSGIVPVATSTDYGIVLNSLTGGKAKITFSFDGFRKCAGAFGEVRDYRGVSPLDESKWILHARGALS